MTTTDIDKDKILGALDSLWGISKSIECPALADKTKGIQDYVVIIKQEVGLAPKV